MRTYYNYFLERMDLQKKIGWKNSTQKKHCDAETKKYILIYVPKIAQNLEQKVDK